MPVQACFGTSLALMMLRLRPIITSVLVVACALRQACAEQGYFVGSSFSGLTNQRVALMKSAVAARKARLTLVLPQWHIDYYEHGSADLMPFDYFYNSSYFIATAAARWEVPVVSELPSLGLYRACLAQVQNDANGCNSADGGSLCPDLKRAAPRWAAKHGVVCLTASCTFHMRLPKEDWRAVSAALKPSDLYAGEVAAVKAALQAQYNTTSYTTVHMRTEDDFKAACAAWKTTGKVPEADNCYVTEDQVASNLSARGMAPGSLLFIASGSPLASMPVLCKAFRCWKREQIRPSLDPRILPKITSHAFLDFLLALEGAAFWGNAYSSFAEELSRLFLEELKPAEFYNGRAHWKRKPDAALFRWQ